MPIWRKNVLQKDTILYTCRRIAFVQLVVNWLNVKLNFCFTILARSLRIYCSREKGAQSMSRIVFPALLVLMAWSDLAVAASDLFDDYLAVDVLPADGFDFPDQKGGQVQAIARGKIVSVKNADNSECGVIAIRHIFYENHEKKTLQSVYARLKSIKVKQGDAVKRGQLIASLGRCALPQAQLQLEPRQSDASPAAFIRSHRQLFVP